MGVSSLHLSLQGLSDESTLTPGRMEPFEPPIVKTKNTERPVSMIKYMHTVHTYIHHVCVCVCMYLCVVTCFYVCSAHADSDVQQITSKSHLLKNCYILHAHRNSTIHQNSIIQSCRLVSMFFVSFNGCCNSFTGHFILINRYFIAINGSAIAQVWSKFEAKSKG